MPITDERVIAEHVPGRPSSCPVTEIRQWFWRALDTRRVLQAGMLAATDIDVATHAEVDIIGAEVDRARAWREQLRAKQAEAERAAAGVASGTPRRSHSYPGRFS